MGKTIGIWKWGEYNLQGLGKRLKELEITERIENARKQSFVLIGLNTKRDLGDLRFQLLKR